MDWWILQRKKSFATFSLFISCFHFLSISSYFSALLFVKYGPNWEISPYTCLFSHTFAFHFFVSLILTTHLEFWKRSWWELSLGTGLYLLRCSQFFHRIRRTRSLIRYSEIGRVLLTVACFIIKKLFVNFSRRRSRKNKRSYLKCFRKWFRNMKRVYELLKINLRVLWM